jgi:DNA repair protein RadA/Sms
MAKAVVKYVCSECATASPRWLGKCPGCDAFGTLVEELQGGRQGAPGVRAGSPVPL